VEHAHEVAQALSLLTQLALGLGQDLGRPFGFPLPQEATR